VRLSSEQREVEHRVHNWPRALARAFRVIAFDWDGTAVENRREDATLVRERIQHLLGLNVYIVITTGTHFGNIEGQLTAAMQGPQMTHLYVCTNRGSEVYGFSPEGEPEVRDRRQATPEEERLLTAAADAVRDTVTARTGLAVGAVYDRLNRRKLDLIPLQEWVDPPKAEIGRLRAATDKRLEDAGLAGGLRAVVEIAEAAVARLGLPQARITSDAKNVEIGLTDKADSMEWIERNIIGPAGVAATRVLIAGDEFGPVGGCGGSDARMRIPALGGAVTISVGPEPFGVPVGVIHVGGGPVMFGAVLDRQIQQWQSGEHQAC
jgi:hypothetical protein